MIAAVILSIAASTPAGAVAVTHIAPLRSSIPAGMEIGSRGTGWSCFPSGSLHWRDLSFNPEEAAHTVAAALAREGIATESSADDGGREPDQASPLSAQILSGTISTITVKACSPQWGLGKMLGGGSKIKGQVSITIDWMLRPREGGRSTNFTTRADTKIAARRGDYDALLTEGLNVVSKAAAGRLRGDWLTRSSE